MSNAANKKHPRWRERGGARSAGGGGGSGLRSVEELLLLREVIAGLGNLEQRLQAHACGYLTVHYVILDAREQSYDRPFKYHYFHLA